MDISEVSEAIQFLEGQKRWLEDPPYNFPGSKEYRNKKIDNIIILLKQMKKEMRLCLKK